MKKIICVMAIMLFGISGLVACGKSDSKYTGIWKMEKISKDGSDYTLEEIKKLGDDGKYDGAFVIKEGGSAVVMDASGQNQELEWKETDKGISLGGKELEYEDNKLTIDAKKDETWYFQKVSDSQNVTDVSIDEEKEK